MTAKLFRVIVPVTDIDQAARFYARVLDLPGERISGGRHYFDCGGTILACFCPAADGDAFDLPPNPDHLYFSVTDLEGTLRAAREAGAVFPAGEVHGSPGDRIATRPWGERSFYVQDPFGNRLCFVDADTLFTGHDRQTQGDC